MTYRRVLFKHLALSAHLVLGGHRDQRRRDHSQDNFGIDINHRIPLFRSCLASPFELPDRALGERRIAMQIVGVED